MDQTIQSEVDETTMTSYQKQKLLGTGASGKAFLVTQDEKQYVMKVIYDKGDMERDILLSFDHPNIVKFQEAFVDNKGRFCIIMEYANGGTLQQFIQARTQPIPENQILDWFIQICSALSHIHSKKIVHRDIKTANIFLNDGNQIKIGDFGISRFVDKQLAQTFIGTPYYLSPEIVQNQPYNTKSDIWSLGVLLYELCTFKYPFGGESIHQLALKIVKGKFAPISAQTYSQSLKALISQLLVIDQNKRPSVDQILELQFIKSRIKNQPDKKTQPALRPQIQVVIKKDDYKQQKMKEKQEKIEQQRKQMREDRSRGQSQKSTDIQFIEQAQKKYEKKEQHKKQRDIPIQIYLPFQKEPIDGSTLDSIQQPPQLDKIQKTPQLDKIQMPSQLDIMQMPSQQKSDVLFTTANIQFSIEKLEKIKLFLENILQFDQFRKCYSLVEQALKNKENLFDQSNEIRKLIFDEQNEALQKSFNDWYSLLVLLVGQENQIDIEFS